jgi:hypothetical protein
MRFEDILDGLLEGKSYTTEEDKDEYYIKVDPHSVEPLNAISIFWFDSDDYPEFFAISKNDIERDDWIEVEDS